MFPRSAAVMRHKFRALLGGDADPPLAAELGEQFLFGVPLFFHSVGRAAYVPPGGY